MEKIYEFTKGKLVLTSKLLKEVKNEYKKKGNDNMSKKYIEQRRIVETLLNDGLDDYIDNLKERKKKLN